MSTDELTKIKAGQILNEVNFDEVMSEYSTRFYKPLVLHMKKLWEVVFPDGKRWRIEDHKLFTQMKAVLKKIRVDLETRM